MTSLAQIIWVPSIVSNVDEHFMDRYSTRSLNLGPDTQKDFDGDREANMNAKITMCHGFLSTGASVAVGHRYV